jgi:hypothetical protein
LAFLGIIDRPGSICQVGAMARSDAEEVSAVLIRAGGAVGRC